MLDSVRLIASATQDQCAQQPRKCLETNISAIFICGGRRSLRFFPKENVWYKLSDKLFRHDHRCNPSQCRTKIYIPCQGSDQLVGSNLMECYAPATNSWAAFQVTTDYRYRSFEGLPVYLYARDTRSMSPGIYRYDPEKNCCNELKMPPTKGTCVVTDEQYIYRIGDFSGHLFTLVPLSTTCRFDP